VVHGALEIEQVAGTDLEAAYVAGVVLLLPSEDGVELLLEKTALLGRLGFRKGGGARQTAPPPWRFVTDC